MLAGCIAIEIAALVAIVAIVHRALQPAGLGFLGFVGLSCAAGVALGAWLVGLMGLILTVT